MSFPDDSKSGPALQLLEEIDKLLARTRAMEEYIEQARASTQRRMMELQAAIERLEKQRSDDQDAIAALRGQAEIQERTLAGRQEALSAVELTLHGKIQSLRQDLAESVREVAERDATIEILKTEIAAQRGKIAAVESHADAASREVEARLREAEEQLKTAQASAAVLEKRHGGRIHELQVQLVEKQLLVEGGVAEIEDLRNLLARLSKQLAEEHFPERAARDEAMEESGATRDPSRTDVVLSRKRELAMKTDDQDEPAAETIEGGAPRSASEESLHDEINRLIREAQERNRILQDRNEELVRVKAELDGLHNRLDQVESSRSQTESALKQDCERMRTEFQAQLALLQAELSQREWALEERQAEARGQEHNLRKEIESLRRELTEAKSAKHDPDAFVFGEPRVDAAGDEESGAIDKQDGLNGYSGAFSQRRRWQSGFGWKRRWRSQR